MAKKKNTEVVTEDQTTETIKNNKTETKQDEVKKEDTKPVEKEKVKEQSKVTTERTEVVRGPSGEYAKEDFINF